MTSGGNNFNDFPDNELTKFKLCPHPTSSFFVPQTDAFCVTGCVFGRAWAASPE